MAFPHFGEIAPDDFFFGRLGPPSVPEITSIQTGEELSDISEEKIGLLERGEVAASWHLGILHDVIGWFGPAQGTGKHLLGKISKRNRNRHAGLRLGFFASQAEFTVDPHGR